MAAFNIGQRLKENDLKLVVTDPTNPAQRIDAFSITYTLFQVTDLRTDTVVTQLPSDRMPARFDVGHYFADETIDSLATIGEYEIRWSLRRTMISPTEIITARYSVIGLDRFTEIVLSEAEKFLIHRLRILLRDNNPERYYKFQSPTPDAQLQGFTENFGFIWTDEELLAHLQTGLSEINMRPPETGWVLENAPATLLGLLLVGASVYSLSSLESMWIAEEFNYSINGISLDIDRAAKYASQRDWYDNRFETMVERYKASINIIRGLRQPRYAIGLTSRLGPFSRRGAVALKNYTDSSRPEF